MNEARIKNATTTEVRPQSEKIRLFSWNVNGLRAVLRKGALQTFLETEHPDILCLQEIKCKPEQLNLLEANALKDYQIFWHPADRPGYSGTATLVRASKEPAPAKAPSTANELASSEGRVLALDFDNFYLVNVYTPNSKPDLSRLELRKTDWDPAFIDYLKELEKEKPVITCGDFNCAHEDIDLARPAQNHHSAGFTNEEREGVANLIAAGFTDTFRAKHPKDQRYTWWSHWGEARKNNVGWRIDYFFISDSLVSHLQEAQIHEQITGSDHCPISITMEF